MSYRKFNADNLFDGYRLYDNSRVLVTDENGRILDLIPLTEAGDDIEKHKGILSPGLYQLSLPPGIKSFEKCDPSPYRIDRISLLSGYQTRV
ncbi:MAG: hypothetical protein WDO19_10215 [Bacteroidota bacterium]